MRKQAYVEQQVDVIVAKSTTAKKAWKKTSFFLHGFEFDSV